MRVFVAGATGAIGKQLVPRLVAAGHEVHGMTRSESKRALLRRAGRGAGGRRRARSRSGRRGGGPGAAGRDRPPADRDRGARHAAHRPRLRADQPAADRGHRPPALGRAGGRACGGSWRRATSAPTRARARRSRARRTRSIPSPAGAMRARRRRRSATSRRRCSAPTWTEGIVLRYGGFYGPGTSMAPGGESVRDGPQAQVPAGRRRRRRVVVHPHRRRRRGDGGGGRARQPRRLQRRRRRSRPGRRVAAGAGRRRSAPRSRCACRGSSGGCSPGEFGVVLMTELRGASNAKAKRELGWRPAHPSWRQGFAAA